MQQQQTKNLSIGSLAIIIRKYTDDHVINSTEESIVARVKEITDGKDVPVVYDVVGQATFMISWDCTFPRTLFVSFGNASGPFQEFELGIRAAKGSRYVTRPTLGTYILNDADLAETTNDLIEIVQSCKVKIPVNQTYALANVPQAHKDLEARRTTGTTVLIP